VAILSSIYEDKNMNQSLSRVTRYLSAISLGIALICLGAIRVQAQNFSLYSNFQSMSPSQLGTLQIKLTYVGPQGETIPTTVFSPVSPDLAVFVPFHRANISYSNDSLPVNTVSVTAGELQAVINNVTTLPNVTAGNVDSQAYLSFSMVNTADITKGFEAVLNLANASDLLEKFRAALAANQTAVQRLNDLACSINILDPARPIDATAQIKIAFSGLRLNRATKRFVGTATLTNGSTNSITGPISVVLDLPSGVELFNANGNTCGTTPQGRPFINLLLTDNVFPANGSAVLPLEFSSPNVQPITSNSKILAGPGTR
jgi:hypothetical protein